jgi:hypothetical protein
VYQVLTDPLPQEDKAVTLRRLKAKIIRLHSIQTRGVLLDTDEKDRVQGEEITLHQYIKARKRQVARRILNLTDETRTIQTDQRDPTDIH